MRWYIDHVSDKEFFIHGMIDPEPIVLMYFLAYVNKPEMTGDLNVFPFVFQGLKFIFEFQFMYF